MTGDNGISIVVTTFNRANRLEVLLDSLTRLEAPGVPCEVIVADNGSVDDTPEVVGRFAAASAVPVRYLRESERGVSFARNAAAHVSSKAIVAFTDDDQEVAPDWLMVVARTFSACPDIGVIGGRVLPRWTHPPPDWITPALWGPTSIVDRGSEPCRLSRRRWMCLPGGNMAWRRKALLAIGGYSGAYPRAQDRELIVRYLLSGGQAMYVPGMVVFHHLDGHRLTKAFFRRWNRMEGRMRAGFAFEEIFSPDGHLRPLPENTPRLLGVSRFLYREWATVAGRYLRAHLLGRREAAFVHQLRLLALSSYLRHRIQCRARPSGCEIEQ